MPQRGPSQNPAVRLIRDAARVIAPNLQSAVPGSSDSLASTLSQAEHAAEHARDLLAKAR